MLDNKRKQNLDFLFVNGGITLGPNGGYEVTYKIAKVLAERGYTVGIVFIRDIFRQILHYYPSHKLKKYVQGHISYSIYSNLVNWKFGWIPKKLIRLLKNIGYEENFGQVNIFFSNGLNLPTSNVAIANGWHNALILNKVDSTHKKFILAQQDDADTRWNPDLFEIAKSGLSLGLPIISTNSEVDKRYGSFLIGSIPLAIDLETFSCKEPPEIRTKKSVLIPLRSFPHKGAKLGLEILDKIHTINPEAELNAFGDISKSLVPSYVNYFGVLSSEELSSLYNRASVFVLPSLVEGFGLTALEAMACGAAVVSTDNGGVKEFLNSGINGIIVEVFDSNVISEVVNKLLNTNPDRVKIAKEGMKTASIHTIDSMVETFLSLVNKDRNS